MSFMRSACVKKVARRFWPLPLRMKKLRNKVMSILSDRMVPQRSERVEQGLRAGSCPKSFHS